MKSFVSEVCGLDSLGAGLSQEGLRHHNLPGNPRAVSRSRIYNHKFGEVMIDLDLFSAVSTSASGWLSGLDGGCHLLGDSLLAMLETAGDLAAETGDGEAAADTKSHESLFSIGGLLTLGMLVVLQAVLGFDNLLYISIESKRVDEDKQSLVRKSGIGLAIVFRIVLLFVVVNLIKLLEDPFANFATNPLEFHMSGHALIVIFGGAFILWTAIKEIYHLLAIHEVDDTGDGKKGNSVGKAITLIVIMNLVFSFDSILSAMALTDSFEIMAAAIVISGMLMIWLADHVAEFLKKNRMYEVLGLFVLFIVGVMLVSEGGHLAEIQLFGYHVTPMAKSTFYFVLFVLVIVDVVQGRYQKNLLAQQKALQQVKQTAQADTAKAVDQA